ncbi:Flagellar P-ring protein [bacterium HR40]|nr:Flagellar P-ring protein [bacterium HR40]
MRCPLLFLPVVLLGLAVPAGAGSRIKDIADFEGVRDNMLVGYGLVVGLNGTGDSLRNAVFTQESLIAMLERLGVGTRGNSVNTKNVAAVMVTATLPPFARRGSRIDVTVSALGDAKSLLGGTLLVTPLLGADGEVYAVAQGPLAVGGFTAGGKAETVTKGVPTVATVPGGAIVEREVGFELASMAEVRLALRNPDFTTARRVAEAIDRHLGTATATAMDPTTVVLRLPPAARQRLAPLLAELEQLEVEPDQPARVVIDESTGTIVLGDKVRISRVAIAQGNLTIRVTEQPAVSQPGPFSRGVTAVVPRTDVQVDEQADRKVAILEPAPTLDQLVDGLNALGVGPRDMIAIIRAIRAAGALQADIEVM